MPESVRAMVAPPTSSQSFVPFESQVKSTKGCLACLALPCHACRLSQKCSSHVGSPNSDREAGQGRRLSSRRLGSVIRVTLWCFRGFTFFDFGSHRGLRFSKKKSFRSAQRTISINTGERMQRRAFFIESLRETPRSWLLLGSSYVKLQ